MPPESHHRRREQTGVAVTPQDALMGISPTCILSCTCEPFICKSSLEKCLFKSTTQFLMDGLFAGFCLKAGEEALSEPFPEGSGGT